MKVGVNVEDDMRRLALVRREIGEDNKLVWMFSKYSDATPNNNDSSMSTWHKQECYTNTLTAVSMLFRLSFHFAFQMRQTMLFPRFTCISERNKMPHIGDKSAICFGLS